MAQPRKRRKHRLLMQVQILPRLPISIRTKSINMKLTELAGHQIKGRRFRHQISSGITVFSGENGVGKSARLNAIPLSLFGYLPGMGKRNEDVFQLSGGSSMSAETKFSDGPTAGHRWMQAKQGIKCEALSMLGDSVTPMCVDAREYFSLSDRERTKLVFRLSGCQQEFGLMVVAKAKAIQLEDHDADAEAVVTAICGEISTMWNNRVAGAEGGKPLSPPEWLEKFAEIAKLRCSASQASAKKMSSTLEGLTELRQQSKQLVNSAAEQQLAELNQRIASLTADQREAASQLSAAEKRYSRKLELEAALSAASTVELDQLRAQVVELECETRAHQFGASQARAAYDDNHRSVSQTVMDIERLKQWVSESRVAAERVASAALLLNPTSENSLLVKNGEVTLAQWTSALESYRSQTSCHREKLQAIQSRLVTEEAACRVLEKSLRDNQESQSKLSAQPCCSECEASEPGWADRVMEKLKARHADASAALGQAAQTLADSRNEAKALQQFIDVSLSEDEKIAKLRVDAERLISKLEAAKLERQRAEKVIADASTASVEQLQRQIEALEAKLAGLRNEEPQLKAALEAAIAADNACNARVQQLRALQKQVRELEEAARVHDRLRGELESIADAKPPTELAGKVEQLASELAVLQQKVQPLTLQVRQANAAKGEVAAKLKAAEAALRVSREEQVWRKVKAIVDEIQAEAVQESILPILHRANLIAGSILPSKLDYHDGSMGRFDGAVFIPVETFNTSDKLVTFAAVSVALAAASGSPLKLLILDDLDNLGVERFKPLFGAIRDAIEQGVITQCVGAIVRGEELAGVEGVEVVQLTK